MVIFTITPEREEVKPACRLKGRVVAAELCLGRKGEAEIGPTAEAELGRYGNGVRGMGGAAL